MNPMLFCLAIHRLLFEIETMLRQRDPLARAVAYLDDINIMIAPQHMQFALDTAAQVLARAKLVLNPSKSEVCAPPPFCLPPQFPCCRTECPRVMRLHAHATPVQDAADALLDSQLTPNAKEFHALAKKRQDFFEALTRVRKSGLS